MDIFMTSLQQQQPTQQTSRVSFKKSKASLLDQTISFTNTRNVSMLDNSKLAAMRRASISPGDQGRLNGSSKRLLPKEYFQKYIREENKKYIQKQRKLTIEHKGFIEYDRHNKQNFKDKVRDYMVQMDREEELILAQAKMPIEGNAHGNYDSIQLEELNLSKQEESELLPSITQNKARYMINKKISNDLSRTIDAKSLEQQPHLASLSIKKKEIPRYMQPNQAWLSKDKHLSGDMVMSMKDTSQHGKSKVSSMFPGLTQHLLKKKQENQAEIFIEENLQIGKASKEAKKFFVINREDPLIIELFKKICQEKRDSNIIRARLTKGKLKAHLSRKYKGKVAEKILEHLDISIPLDFNQYCELLERLMNFGQDKLKRIAFNVFNFNNDRYVCQLDLYSIMKMYEGDDQVFVDAYSYDICKLIAFLDQKKAQKGNQNYEFNQKLKAIQRKVDQAMRAQAQSRAQNKATFKRNGGDQSKMQNTTTGTLSKQASVLDDDSIQRSETASEEDDEDDEDEDTRSYLDDDFLEDEDAKTTTNKTTKGALSRKSGDFYSRRNSMMSRKGGNRGDPRKDFKRMNTNMSRMSRTSKVSRYSKNSGKSVFSGRSRVGSTSRRYQGGFFSHYSENQEEEEKENPFDAIFGKDIYKRMKGNKDYIERMTLAEFRAQVPWGSSIFPQFIIDLISYISGFLIEEHIKQKKAQEKEDQENQQLHVLISQRKEAGEKVDENFMLEQLKRQRMTDADADLMQTRNQIGDSRYKKLVRFFRNVCKNPVEQKDSELFLTQESLSKKLKNHFGHKCDFLATRLYYLLSGNVNLKRIGLKEFIERTNVLWEGSLREQNRFAFKLIDIDHDGLLGGPDLLTVQESIDIYCPFGQEILTLVDHYVSTHLMVKDRVNPVHFLHLDNFMMLLKGRKACIIDELRLKIQSKEGKHKANSVFFRDTTKQEEFTRGRRGLGPQQPTGPQRQVIKRAILMWTGGNQHKEKKKVTFAYIPAYKDDEDEGYHRRKASRRIAKDLPTVLPTGGGTDDKE